MNRFKTFALAATAAVGAIGAPLPSNAAVIDLGTGGTISVSTFCTGGNTYRTGFYSYTCYDGTQTVAPASPPMAITDIAGSAQVTINQFLFSGILTGTLQISAYPNGVLTGHISYFVEIAPGGDPDAEPARRFTTIRLSQEVLAQGAANTSTRKQITGQNTSVVPNATFTADLLATGQGGTDDATCGVCRKFAVTDTFNNQVNGGLGAGRIQSYTNTYETDVPAPAPLALMALGLFGVGAARRLRKA